MTSLAHELRRVEFEARIFVSFGLAAIVVLLSEIVFQDSPTLAIQVGRAVGLQPTLSQHLGALIAAAILLLATLLRMSAGSVLTSTRVMAFAVQSDALMTRGPYRLTRNPIYVADLTAFVGFAVVMRPIGLLLPALLYLHYRQLIAFEETALQKSFGASYRTYLASAPRLLPTPRSLRRLPETLRELELNRDGIRHNALYVLFLPGLAVSAVTGQFWHAVAIGLPGALDWAVIHTRIGLPRRTTRPPVEGA